MLKTQNANLKRKAPGGKGDKSDQNPNKKFKGDKKSGNPMTLKTLLNGSNICEGYNKGSCTGSCARTPPELHVCNGKMENGKQDVARGRQRKSTQCTVCLQKSWGSPGVGHQGAVGRLERSPMPPGVQATRELVAAQLQGPP